MSMSPYSPAAGLLSQIWETKKSIKALSYDKKGSLKVTKSTYAQVCHVLENQNVLQKVLTTIKIPCRNESLLYVLLYELLLGPNQKIRGGGALKRQIMKNEKQLREVLSQCGAISSRAIFPRYARINTLKYKMNDALSDLKDQTNDIYIDPHVPDLLVLKPNIRIHDIPSVKSGKIVLQDKSSCFSALCLINGNEDPLKGDCIDACAAPGQKTSHLAALLPKSSTIYACDRNEKRLEVLQQRIQLLVGNTRSVVTKRVDFLTTKQSDFPNTKGILLDPSCSGSGIFTSLNRLTDSQDDDLERIQHLANFQSVALQHAMSFESVERIVYSTCSIHNQENEEVVKEALKAQGDKWQLRSPFCLRGWERRGNQVEGLTSEQTKCLIRADRDDDTNGFFVSYFERKKLNISSWKATDEDNKGKLVVPKNIPMYAGQFRTDGGGDKLQLETKTVAKQLRASNAKADGKSPKADGKSPKADGKSPKADGKSPKADGKSPKADGKSPKAEGKSPKTDGKFPKPDGKSQTADEKPQKAVPKKRARS